MWRDSVAAILKSRTFQLVATSVASLTVGGVVGSIITRRRIEQTYVRFAANEIREARELYRQRLEEKPDLDELVPSEDPPKDTDEFVNEPTEEEAKQTAKLIRKHGYVAYDKMFHPQSPKEHAEVEASKRMNIFDEPVTVKDHPVAVVEDGGYDLDDELEKRDAGNPWIVEASYFLENPEEYHQVTMTYYEDDDILADEDDQGLTASEEERNIGKGNLRFGRGSQDPNLVYIANEKLQVMYEIQRNAGSYAEIVLGYPSAESLEHEDRPKIRKFRDYD